MEQIANNTRIINDNNNEILKLKQSEEKVRNENNELYVERDRSKKEY